MRKEDNQALSLLENEIKSSPSNLELQLCKAVFLYDAPFYDYPKALEMIEQIRQQDPLFGKAVILKAYIEYIHRGEVSTACLNQIDLCIKSMEKSRAEYPQLFAVRALYFRDCGFNEFQKALEEAIVADQDSVWMYELLGWCFNEQGLKRESQQAYRVALGNVVHVYADDEFVDPSSFEEFLAESIRGVHLSKVNFESLKEKAI